MHAVNGMQGASDQRSMHHHICAWCHQDLGILHHESEFDSYGICTDCVARHFTHLYASEAEVFAIRPSRMEVIDCESNLQARSVGSSTLLVR